MKTIYLVILPFILLIALVSMACNTASALVFSPESLPAAEVGAAYETEIRITKNNTPVGEFSISKGSLPAGLELVKTEGQDSAKISGTPEETGTFTFTVSVWCYGTNVSGQVGEKEYTMIVKEAE